MRRVALSVIVLVATLGWITSENAQAAESSWIAFNDTRFTGFALRIGIVGEYSFAEELQSGVHSVVDATDPQGWEHQLDNELVLNFHDMKKRKLWNKPSFDGAFTSGPSGVCTVPGPSPPTTSMKTHWLRA